MNIAKYQKEMLSTVQALEKRLESISDANVHARLGEEAKVEIDKIRKRCKRKIDKKASGWFSIHEIGGLEKKLRQVSEQALMMVNDLVSN